MSKCINDPTKKFTGKEKNPKGRGFCASAEPDGTIMIGKDCNYYQVKTIKNGKKWIMKEINIDFDNLPIDCFTNVWFPQVQQLKLKETGLEEKFGGQIPFFVKGETWPVDSEKIPMVFFCQFKDPRKEDNILYRVFLPIDNENDCILHKVSITKIELSKDNLKNQIRIIKNPVDAQELNTIFETYIISGWDKKSEFKQYKYIIGKYNIPMNYGKLYDIYMEHEKTPSSRIKIGGTPTSTQDEDTVQEYDLIQLTDSQFLPYMWGDCGIGHISTDCKLIWDCC